MAESKYSKYILETPKDKLHTGEIFEGFLASPDKLGVDCQILYSVITEADLEGDEIEPHVHDFSHVMCFFGSNPFDKYDFDAEIDFYMDGHHSPFLARHLVPMDLARKAVRAFIENGALLSPVRWSEV